MMPAMPALRTLLPVVVTAALCGCGERTGAAPFTVPFGTGASYRPSALWHGVASGRPVAGLRCVSAAGPRDVAHVELFAHGRGIVVPAGLGVAGPHRTDGAYVRGGRCSYPLRTLEPTGLVELAPGRRLTLGHVFALLGQRLTPARLGDHRGAVRVWRNGRLWHGEPGAVPLRRHDQVVVAAGTQRVPVHAAYRFPPGR
jgi:hypothetical protein